MNNLSYWSVVCTKRLSKVSEFLWQKYFKNKFNFFFKFCYEKFDVPSLLVRTAFRYDKLLILFMNF